MSSHAPDAAQQRHEQVNAVATLSGFIFIQASACQRKSAVPAFDAYPLPEVMNA